MNKPGRPRTPTLAELRQQQPLEAQNNMEVKVAPSNLPDNRKELLRLYKLCQWSNGNRNKTEAGRA